MMERPGGGWLHFFVRNEGESFIHGASLFISGGNYGKSVWLNGRGIFYSTPPGQGIISAISDQMEYRIINASIRRIRL
jgi:hypothetical protein